VIGEEPSGAGRRRALQGPPDDRGGPGAGRAPAEIDVLGQAGVAVAEVVGDLAGGVPGLVEPGSPCPAFTLISAHTRGVMTADQSSFNEKFESVWQLNCVTPTFSHQDSSSS
jgi:hypothetical protein